MSHAVSHEKVHNDRYLCTRAGMGGVIDYTPVFLVLICHGTTRIQ